MFGIDFLKILLIAGLIILLLKPKDYPRLFFQAGRVFKKLQIFYRHFQRGIDAFLDQTEGEVSLLTKERLLKKKKPQKKPHDVD